MLRIVKRVLSAAPFDDFKKSHRTCFQRPNLRLEIRATLRSPAHVRKQQLHHVDINVAAAHNAHRRNAQPLAVNIRRKPHRTRRSPANVSVMRSVGYEKDWGEMGKWGRG